LLSRAGRKWLDEVWQAATETAARTPPLSPLPGAVGAEIAEATGGSTELHDARYVVIRTGYATRIVLAEPTEQPAADPAWFGLPGRAGVDLASTDPAVVREMVDGVRRLASAGFDSAMTLPEDVWTAYLITATREFQKTLAGDVVSWRELGRETVDELLRCGYVIRCLEEALEPAPRSL